MRSLISKQETYSNFIFDYAHLTYNEDTGTYLKLYMNMN